MDVGQDRRHPFATQQDGRLAGARWPVRAQRLLETSYSLCEEGLQEPLRRCMGDLEQQLFALAERAKNAAVQQDCFASRQRVLQGRAAFSQRFVEQLGKAFEQIGEGNAAADSLASDGNPWQSLELVDPGEQEVSMTLEQLGARGEVRHSSALYELGYRLAVLIAAPPLDGKMLPVGSYALAKACQAASETLELPLQHQLMLLQHFDQWVIQGLGPLYEALNTRLKGDGILPHLRSIPIPRHLNKRARTTSDNPEVADEAPAAASSPGSTPTTATTSGASHASGAPMEVLESLRDMLAQQRAGYDGGLGGSGARSANPEELQSALGALQQHLAQVTDRASRELRSAARLREELVAQLNFGKPAGAPRTQLSGEQGDTVELVARLFEQLGQQLQTGGNASHLLTDLQLPVLRMAVADRGFFEKREHPARRLLDTVTTAANDWLDGSDDESNRPLATKLEQLVNRANQEAPSAGLYTTLLADIEHHLALLTRKAQASERRHIEAAQGRERLDQARRRASELMAERFAQSPPRGLLRALLDRAWSDVLALTLLRHGEESDAFRAQLKITDQLLDRLPVTDRLQLQVHVEAGLQQIGMHAEEAEQVAQRLLGAGTPDPSVELPSATDLALRLKQHQRLGEQSSHEPASSASAAALPATTAVIAAAPAGVRPPAAPRKAPAIERAAQAASASPAAVPGIPAAAAMPTAQPATAAPTPAKVDPRERRIEQHLKGLPFGSWFEFIDATTGQISRRKLAWYSPMSGRCLLVSRRGQRGEEMTMSQLAHEVACGRVCEVPAEQPETMLDRAWRSLTGSLQSRRPSSPEASRP
ncbi:DUF1631 family protein [Rhodanobacter sp. AS-Z3]|uniref:DUF1631 family protein n=1 Tax=Rhodanobacter sp. AS-Z3 TaxID=3031330 RepID=UPI00247AB8A7|nr:DUF1631 family protein [Rhodanobacter sp. AS-Z3]WEN16061.1 DUF1631 family protein [Rhodanobacter sp. AS-Z3]